MKLIHYYPGDEGVKFLAPIKTYLSNAFSNNDGFYISFSDSSSFLESLKERLGEPDLVLLTAHGCEDSILKCTATGFVKDITLDKTRYFKNNFVFAISCSTTEEFGKNAIQENAIVYIGFDSMIDRIFAFDLSDYYKDNIYLEENLEKIFKSIYTGCFNYEFVKFISNCLTARELYDNISIRTEVEVARLVVMPLEQINKKYGTDLKKTDERIVNSIVRLEFMTKVREIKKKMTIYGEEHYIPCHYIAGQSWDKLFEILDKVEFIEDLRYSFYKVFVKANVYKELGDDKNFLECLTTLAQITRESNHPFSYSGLKVVK